MPNLTKEVIEKTSLDLTYTQGLSLQTCITSLEGIKKSNKISESNLVTLTNVWRELDVFREIFYTRLFNALKRGDMVTG